MRRIFLLGTLVVAWFTSCACFAQKKIDLPGFCRPPTIEGCTREWDVKTSKCMLNCTLRPLPGEPIVVGPEPGPGKPTGPAAPGTSDKNPAQLREIIKGGSTSQRAQLATWLATPTISHTLSAEPKPLPEKSLRPEVREVLKVIREGTEKDRSAVADKLFKDAK